MRSGLACCSAATCEVKSVAPSLGHSSLTTCTSIPYFFVMAEERRPVVAPVGVVRVDAGHRAELPLPAPRGARIEETITASTVPLSVERNEYFGLASIPRRPSGWSRPRPRAPDRLHLLGHRPQRQPHPGRDGPGDGVDLVLQNELAEALDGVLGARLLLDHQLDLSPQNPAGSVDPLVAHCTPRSPESADRREHTRLGRQHPDLHGPGLREGRGPVQPEGGGDRCRAAERQEASPSRSHLRASLLESSVQGPCADGMAPAAAESIRRTSGWWC